jgi:hypothetical protein
VVDLQVKLMHINFASLPSLIAITPDLSRNVSSRVAGKLERERGMEPVAKFRNRERDKIVSNLTRQPFRDAIGQGSVHGTKEARRRDQEESVKLFA